MPRPRRTHAQARADMREGILRCGREQLQTRGAAALSVREIARDLGVASSAVYRHVRSRDELLTLLVVDAFTDLADTVEDTPSPGADPASRLHSMSHTIRRWAVNNPSRWALIYGSPVPGYSAPPDRTGFPGTRVMASILSILTQGTPPDNQTPPSPELGHELDTGAAELGIVAPTPAIADAVSAWTGLIGTISAEIFGQLGPELTGFGSELLDRWIAGAVHHCGL